MSKKTITLDSVDFCDSDLDENYDQSKNITKQEYIDALVNRRKKRVEKIKKKINEFR